MTDVATPVRSRESLDSPRLWRPFATGGISLAGIGISIYLLIVHYEPQALVCSTSGIVNCEKVLTSPQSVILGIPVPMFGIAFFVAILAMVVYLISQEALTLHAICLWCTSVHVLTFALFLIVITGWEDTGYAQSLYED